MQSRWLNLQALKHGAGPTKAVELGEGATVGDLLKQIAALKKVPLRDLFICEDRWPLPGMTGLAYATCTVVGSTPILAPAATVPSGITVKLLKSEVPEGTDIQLGGVDDLEDLPDVITVEPRFVRTTLDKAEAMELHDELIRLYSDEDLQKKLTKLKEKVLSGKVDKTKYSRMLPDLTLPLQKKILNNWGFEASARGVIQMISLLNAIEDQDLNLRASISRGLLGLNFDWLPASETSS